MNAKDIETKITGSLSSACTPAKKQFWYGYLLSASDNQMIDHSEYLYLYNTIEQWRKGDTTSVLIPPYSMR